MKKLILSAAFAALVYAQPPQGKKAVPNPNYVTIHLESAVINKPAAEVWKRVGKFCDISEWARFPGCMITAGKDGELGAVRTIGNEILVGMTELSYTYTQPVMEGQVYNLYHGTMEARPVTPATSKIVYTLILDESMLAEDRRQPDVDQRTNMVKGWLDNMKILGDGGTLPPAAARGGGGKGPGGPGGFKGKQ